VTTIAWTLVDLAGPGAAKLRAILRGDIRVTLSALEARFLARLREADLGCHRRTAWRADGEWIAAGPTGD
jgi:hypothetical protein